MSDRVKVATPVGELYYVNIAGQGKLNYNEDGYEYVASIRLSGEKAEQLIEKFDEVAATMPKGETLKSCGYRELVKDKEGKLRSPTKKNPKQKDEEDTGIFEFLFKTNTTYQPKDGAVVKKKINVFNKNAKKIELGDVRIGNGTLGAISGVLEGGSYKKEFSVSAYLNSIQIVKLIEYEGNAGFEAQEDGDFEGVEDSESGFTGQPEETSEAPAKVKSKPRL